MIYNLIQKYFLLFLIYSSIGFILEVIQSIFTSKKIKNRGFLIGPIIPIYGVGGIAMTLLLGRFIEKPLLLFFMSSIIFSILEYFTGYVLEKIFKLRWWDYSNRKYNINGRICLEFMIPMSVLGCIVMYVLNPIFMGFINSLNPLLLNVIFYTTATFFLCDVYLSFTTIYKLKKDDLSPNVDSTDEISDRVREVLFEKNVFYRRLANAFPLLKSSKKV